MSELTLTLIKLGFLAVLWLFVLSAVSAIRADLFGTAPKRAAVPAAVAAPKPPKRSRSAPTRVVVVDGPDRGNGVPLGAGPIVLGRGAEAGLPLTDEYVSSAHARLVPRDGQWYVEDLGSTNGTSVGGAKVSGLVPVGPKTPVRLGKTSVELRS